MKKGFILISGLLILVVGVLFITQTAMADFIGNYTGHSAMWESATGYVQDGVINYAVLENGTTNWIDDIDSLFFHPGLSGSVDIPAITALDTTAPYLYLYQAVNTTTDSATLMDTFINTVTVSYSRTPMATSITSWGYFTFEAGGADTGNAVVFVDAQGKVQDGNNLGNYDNEPSVPGDPKKPDPRTGFTASFDQLASGIIPEKVVKMHDPFTGTIKEFMNTADLIEKGETGTIFGFTSTLAPTWGNGTLQDTVTAQNDVPTPGPIPEPSTILLLGLGFFALCGTGVSRRKKA